METKYIWIDGKFVAFGKSQIHLLNHSLHYGSAVFEEIRCYDTEKGPAVFRLTDHIKRLFHSAYVMGMKISYTPNQIIKTIKELIKKNGLSECYIRPIAFYGSKMGLLPEGAPLSVAIAVWPWGKYLKKDAVSIKISNFARIHPKTSFMTAKISGHYANSIMASLEAHSKGFDEALLLDFQGNIAEGPGENIFFVKGRTLFTPKKGTILPGITRGSVMKIARDLGYDIVEKDIKPSEIKNFSEAFFTGTAAEINAIGKIDGKSLDGSNKFTAGKLETRKSDGKEGPVTAELKNIYLDAVHGKVKKYGGWLEYV